MRLIAALFMLIVTAWEWAIVWNVAVLRAAYPDVPEVAHLRFPWMIPNACLSTALTAFLCWKAYRKAKQSE
jgi:hypothetical protein